MRNFYLYKKGQSVVDQLTWIHYTILLTLNNENAINYIDRNIKNINQDKTI